MINTLLAQGMTVITYGGGEILQKIFQAISMLFNDGSDGLIRPLMILCASIGGFYACSKAFFSNSCESLFLRYLFPLLIISSIFLIPTTTVHIEDVLKTSRAEGINQTSFYTVDHVPLLLAKFAETISSIGYRLAEKIEDVMHMPNDANYNATGMIFGSESALDMTRYRVSNANLEQNLRLFSKQCVLYDIALNRYSLDDVKKAVDLWSFFEQKTSNVRMMRYCPPEMNADGIDRCSYVSCKGAVEKMKPYIEKEKEYYAKLEIGKNLPLTFQALTGIQQNSKDLISQQLTMNVLSDELSGGKFAKNRAYAQQQSTYRTMGSLASGGLVTMRVVFEALIYASFIFILPLSLTPGGPKYLINWAWLTIWIQMWPPLYTILNYTMQVAARYKFDGWFNGLSMEQKGLSFFTSIGMQNLHDDVFALAGFLAVSVPYISYILLKEGLSSFVQLASSLTAPAQHAASAAAAELASGNYSFANTSFAQTSFENASAFQTNMAPSVSSGFFMDNQGDMTATYGGESPILRQHTSELRTGISLDETIGQSFQTQKQQAQSTLDSATDTYLSSLSNSSRISSDYISHLANSQNHGESTSGRTSYAVQNSASNLQSIAEDWGKQYGFNAKESLEILATTSSSGGIGGSLILASLEAKVGHSESYHTGASRDEVISSAQHVAKREDFQQNLQNINDYAYSQAFSSSEDEGSRNSLAYTHSRDTLNSYLESYQTAQSRLEQISENASWFEQNSQLIKRSLNQDFINWASDKYACSGGSSEVMDILSRDNPDEMQTLIREFTQDIKEKFTSPTNYHDMDEGLSSRGREINTEFLERASMVNDSIEKAKSYVKSDYLDNKHEDLGNKYSDMKGSYESNSDTMRDKMQTYNESSTEHFDHTNERYLAERAWSGPSKSENLSGQFKIKEASFWTTERE